MTIEISILIPFCLQAAKNYEQAVKLNWNSPQVTFDKILS